MIWVICLAVCLQAFVGFSTGNDDSKVAHRRWMREPTVMIAVLVRNKAHTLPWFLYYIQNLDYPKQRIRLWYLYLLTARVRSAGDHLESRALWTVTTLNKQ